MAGLERGRLGLDALHETVVQIEHENRDVAEQHALFAAGRGIDDRLAVGAALAQPDAVAGRPGASERAAGDLRLHALGLFVQHRGDRVVDGGRKCADGERRDQRRRDELPGRHAGGARDHELEPPRQAEEARHRADQDAERQDALGDLRHAIERRLGDQQRGRVRHVGEPPHHLEVVDQDDQREHAGKHRDQRRPGSARRNSARACLLIAPAPSSPWRGA